MIGIILLIVVVVLAVLVIGIYNRLVALRQNCNQAFADVGRGTPERLAEVSVRRLGVQGQSDRAEADGSKRRRLSKHGQSRRDQALVRQMRR